MWDSIIVGAIVLAAAGYALYRLFMRPSCGCDCDCCPSRPAKQLDNRQPGTCHGDAGNSCSCGK